MAFQTIPETKKLDTYDTIKTATVTEASNSNYKKLLETVTATVTGAVA